jgi:hypothetical protein
VAYICSAPLAGFYSAVDKAIRLFQETDAVVSATAVCCGIYSRRLLQCALLMVWWAASALRQLGNNQKAQLVIDALNMAIIPGEHR